ncbi:MAG: glycosyltransferase [Bacteroidales bacterium]
MIFDQLYNTSDPVIWIIAGMLAFSLLIQFIYYLFIYARVPGHRSPKTETKPIPVSVVICARNEAENLSKNLPRFLSQEYPEYEVVVVNDCSTDHTEEVLMNMKVKYPNFRYTTIPQDNKFTHGKKLALTVGIKSANHEHMLLSDADCYPSTDQWIRSMTRHFSKETELILGVGKYERKRGLLNIIVRYETLYTAMQYLSFAIRGKAYMGVGRNMAYKKELFYRHKGFASHLKVLSGDDDLFVNEATTKKNTAVEFSHGSLTLSSPPASFNGWFKQKKRHLSSSKYYRFSSKFRLGMEYFTRILFYSSSIFLLFTEHWKWVGIGALVLLALVRMLIVKLTMQRLDERDLLLPSLLLDPLMPLILAAVWIANYIRPREPKWN